MATIRDMGKSRRRYIIGVWNNQRLRSTTAASKRGNIRAARRNKRSHRWKGHTSVRRCTRMVEYWASKGWIDLKPNGIPNHKQKNVMGLLAKSFRVIKRLRTVRSRHLKSSIIA